MSFLLIHKTSLFNNNGQPPETPELERQPLPLPSGLHRSSPFKSFLILRPRLHSFISPRFLHTHTHACTPTHSLSLSFCDALSSLTLASFIPLRCHIPDARSLQVKKIIECQRRSLRGTAASTAIGMTVFLASLYSPILILLWVISSCTLPEIPTSVT